MFPCLRGYNSGKNGTTIKSKVSFKIYMQFSFWWALKFLHLDHWNLRNWSLKMVTLLLKSWQNPTHFHLLLYSSLSAINYFHLIQIVCSRVWIEIFIISHFFQWAKIEDTIFNMNRCSLSFWILDSFTYLTILIDTWFNIFGYFREWVYYWIQKQLYFFQLKQ